MAGVFRAHAGDGFEDKYRAYKKYIKSGADAFSKKDYASVIMNCSKAIDLSPFEATSYYVKALEHSK